MRAGADEQRKDARPSAPAFCFVRTAAQSAEVIALGGSFLVKTQSAGPEVRDFPPEKRDFFGRFRFVFRGKRQILIPIGG